MKIILLTGTSGCGKTTTFNMLYDKINPKEEDGDIIQPKSQLGGDPKDFECIIKYNGKTAFYSMGDFSCCILEAFEKYDEEKCDFLVCACNNRFKRPFSRIKKYPHKIIEKMTSLRGASNIADMDQILKELYQ